MLVAVTIIQDFLLPGLNIKERIPQSGKGLKRAGSAKRAQSRSAEEPHGVSRQSRARQSRQQRACGNGAAYCAVREKMGFSIRSAYRAPHEPSSSLQQAQPGGLAEETIQNRCILCADK